MIDDFTALLQHICKYQIKFDHIKGMQKAFSED